MEALALRKFAVSVKSGTDDYAFMPAENPPPRRPRSNRTYQMDPLGVEVGARGQIHLGPLTMTPAEARTVAHNLLALAGAEPQSASE